MKELIIVIMTAILVENFVLTKFLGICPFLGVSKKLSPAIGMSGAVIFVMTLASIVTWPIYKLLLEPNDLHYLQTLSFILVIAGLVQLVEIVLKKFIPPLYKSLGVFLPLITTNCAVLGVTILNIDNEYTFVTSVGYSLGAGIGFGLALMLFAGVREKLENCDVPEAFKGLPISLVSAALVSLTFFGFQGLFG